MVTPLISEMKKQFPVCSKPGCRAMIDADDLRLIMLFSPAYDYQQLRTQQAEMARFVTPTCYLCQKEINQGQPLQLGDTQNYSHWKCHKDKLKLGCGHVVEKEKQRNLINTYFDWNEIQYSKLFKINNERRWLI